MKRFSIAIVLMMLLVSPSANALVLSSSQIQLMSRYCTQASGHLKRLHHADALLRVNLGQHYENISTRLMAPMNSRIALAGGDGVEMSKTTVAFNQELKDFRAAYFDYDRSISDAMDIDCQSQPVEFYQAIEISRSERARVHDHVQKLGSLIEDYKQQFEEFAKDYLASSGASSE